MIRARVCACLVSISMLPLFARPVAAQQRAAGFALNRYDPSERGSDFFVAESLDLRGHGRLALGIVADWAHKPLVIYDRASGDEISSLVQDQVVTHVGGSVVLWDRLRLGLSFPLTILQAGDGVVASGTELAADGGAQAGDLRAGADVRLLGTYGEPFTLALGVQAHLPTGSQNAMTSDGTTRIAPRLLAAGQLGSFEYAGRLQFNLRPERVQFVGTALGHEVFLAAAAGRRFGKNLLLGLELFGSTTVSEGSQELFGRSTTPFELLAMGRVNASDSVRLGFGVGPGLTRGYGAPLLRGLFSVELVQPAIEDRDGDTIVDSVDACPEVAGVKSSDPKKHGCPPDLDPDRDGVLSPLDACPEVPGIPTADPKTNGCPPPKDTDRDGIIDTDDACPRDFGPRTDDPKTNGCPPPKDTDRDGIIDVEDACPSEHGVRTGDPKTNGCPPPKDTDRDGIFDETDACPNDPGPASDDPKKNGCPLARIEGKQIKIVEQVKFAYNKDMIAPESDAILNAVLRILTDNPAITKVEVHGHTDSQGQDAYNLRLSQRRAAAVVRWLVTHGVAQARLSSQGFGETEPIDDNKTEEGRRNNRRVEFHIMQQ